MEVRFQKLHPLAKLPTYSYDGDAGLDLYACERVWLPCGIPVAIPTGLAVEIPEGWEGQVRPRSSLNLSGFVTGFGTIDSGFRGELRVCLTDQQGSRRIEAGQRIAQLILAPTYKVVCVAAEELAPSARGAKGWGSSGS